MKSLLSNPMHTEISRENLRRDFGGEREWHIVLPAAFV